jgi:hypothetical protein
MKTVRLTPTHTLSLPDDLNERTDPQVSSFWRSGEPLLLQMSSYLRNEGQQVSAKQRLQQRIEKTGGVWREKDAKLHPDPELDEAVAETTDLNGLAWIHAYFVWPHLTVYATISGPPESVTDGSWAVDALSTLRLATH